VSDFNGPTVIAGQLATSWLRYHLDFDGPNMWAMLYLDLDLETEPLLTAEFLEVVSARLDDVKSRSEDPLAMAYHLSVLVRRVLLSDHRARALALIGSSLSIKEALGTCYFDGLEDQAELESELRMWGVLE
jgi:hypothetical protein